ncbi:g-D-glutamyl-meso-diaminopimelate peptidase [Neobacillus niacini]|uniref:M14 family zinc carboxypeptidase n=1 Tax=Neobacillus niacini TaxID=86668 RepID=UPI002856D056|nr:M14 family zinc carboxypeptidase [Neobacillus niacini]MDR7076742.1 g-D-glutamyl-meso-diaminopimelate peptidase [Neobacillus niacini]
MKKLLCILLLLSFRFENASLAKIVDTNKPYSYDLMKQDIVSIEKKYKVVKVKKIGKTHFGRTIYGIKLGKGKQNIVLIGAHHGREWMTSMLLMKQLKGYTYAYENQTNFGSLTTDILDDVSIWFIPMLNPDGVTIQQNDLNQFPNKHRKCLLAMNEKLEDFDRWKANGLGLDLNRQYPAGWRELSNQPDSPYYQFYRGKKPLEAEEVKALTRFIRKINPVIAVAYHSAGREIFWNYHNGKHLKRDKRIAKKISKLTGYELGKPPKQAIGGGFTDWFITKYQRPAMTIEISPLVGETSPPLEVFESEWESNKYVGLILAEEAKNLSKAKTSR